MKTITQELCSFAAETRWEDLPASIVQETKQVLMEHIGVALGALSTEKAKMMVALGRKYGGPPESSIIGIGDKLSCSNASLVNGELMITLDYQDIIAWAHDGLFVIPPALAIAESIGASGKDLILATAVGLEISSRLARAAGWYNITPEDIRRQKGNQPQNKNAHSNYGAAAAAGCLLRLNPEKMLHALGIAGRHICMSLTAGGGGFGNSGMTKYVVPGWQNTAAVMAALLAEMGYTGDTTTLDDPRRLKWYPEVITEDLGKRWIYNYQMYYKPYPCCGMFHGTLDCVYDAIEQNDLAPAEIEKVILSSRGGVPLPPRTGASSLQEKAKDLESLYAAQFNLPFNIAVLVHRVSRGVEWADPDTRSNPEILNFMDKVSYQADPDYAAAYARENENDPLTDLSKVSVIARGKTFTVERKYRRGTTNTPCKWTEKEVVEKFRHNAERILTGSKIERATGALLEPEKLENISQLMAEVTL